MVNLEIHSILQKYKSIFYKLYRKNAFEINVP